MLSPNEEIRHRKHINMLARMAVDVTPVRRARIAACIVSHNNVVSFGVNQKKSHPFQAQYSKNEDAIYLHAETDCIKNALKHLSLDEIEKATLYIARVKYESTDRKNMIFGLARPCPGCMKAIASFGIKKVIFTEDGEGISQL